MTEHPGATLLRCLDLLGFSQAEFARLAGVSTKHLNLFVKGNAKISADMALRFEAALHTAAKTQWRAEAWMAAQGAWDVEQAREAR